MKRVCPHCGAPMYRNVCEYCQMPVENNVPVPAKRRKHVWLWCILAAVILVAGAVIAAIRMGYMEDASPKIVENDAVVLEKMQESGVFSAGTYLVGEEIPAGEYVVVSDPEETDHLFYAGIYADREKEQELSEGWHEYSAISAFRGQIAMISQRTTFPTIPPSTPACSVWDGISSLEHITFVPWKRKIKISIRYMAFTHRLEALHL